MKHTVNIMPKFPFKKKLKKKGLWVRVCAEDPLADKRALCKILTLAIGRSDPLIGPSGLLLVVSHLFTVPIFNHTSVGL